MEIALYPGELKSHLDYFTDFLDLQNTRYEISRCYFGYKINIFLENISPDFLASHACRFILDFYLKEAVISKIYDEYPDFNTDEAGVILSKLSQKISDTPIKNNICTILCNKKSFNPESYGAFNLKSIMLCVYALTDELCEDLIYSKEKERFVSMIKMFSALSFDKCQKADVEFSQDNRCIVSLDKSAPVSMKNDELLAFLAQKAPECVTMKNTCANPELAGIVSEIFDSDQI